MKAMILAAGEGTRLKPLTNTIPKALLPLDGKPFIEHIILWLKKNGIPEIAVNTCHLYEKVEDYLTNCSKFDVEIYISREHKLLGTAGAVKKIESYFTDDLIIIYGDILSNINLQRMWEFHKSKGGIATLVTYQAEINRQIGIIQLDRNNRIIHFIEKPESVIDNGMKNGGIYILSKEIFKYIPEGKICDFGFDVFPVLIKAGLPMYGYIPRDNEYVLDIGDMDRYHGVQKEIAEGRISLKT